VAGDTRGSSKGRSSKGEKRMEFNLGSGGPRIVLVTFSGDISIERGSGRSTTKE
jgi:hypothetical protein